MNTLYYLETSGLNVLADNLSDYEFNSYFQKALKIDWCISPIVLWEVLLNSSNSRKEFLLCWAQFNCSNYLLKSPTELILSYLHLGMPDSDRRHFWYNRESELEIGKVWSRIHGKLDRTIPVDIESLKRHSFPIRQLSKVYPGVIDWMTDRSLAGYDNEFFHKCMIDLERTLGAIDDRVKNDEKLIKTSLMLGFFLICIGVELDNSKVREYWNGIGINDPVERLDYLVQTSSKIFVKGPLIEMSIMMEAQAEMSGATSRGAVFDSLHTIYCYYADNVISGDGHFHSSPDSRKSNIFSSVISASEFLVLMDASFDVALELFGTKSESD